STRPQDHGSVANLELSGLPGPPTGEIDCRVRRCQEPGAKLGSEIGFDRHVRDADIGANLVAAGLGVEHVAGTAGEGAAAHAKAGGKRESYRIDGRAPQLRLRLDRRLAAAELPRRLGGERNAIERPSERSRIGDRARLASGRYLAGKKPIDVD